MARDWTQLGEVALRHLRGTGWRHLSPGYDPLSGEGARLHGGRFNPPGSFPVLYLCESRACVVAELRRLGERQAIGMAGLLPRVLWRYDVDLEGVLDLADPDRRDDLGVDLDVLVGPDWRSCQRLGAAAYDAGVCALRTPSATGVGVVLAVFLPRVAPGRVEPHLAEEVDLATPALRRAPRRAGAEDGSSADRRVAVSARTAGSLGAGACGPGSPRALVGPVRSRGSTRRSGERQAGRLFAPSVPGELDSVDGRSASGWGRRSTVRVRMPSLRRAVASPIIAKSR